MDPESDPDLTIVLLGKAGAGKSASGNNILGQTAFESKLSFKPVTKKIYKKTGDVLGKRISVIDTPGILATGAETEIKILCQDILQSGRPHLFLLTIKIDRFSKEDEDAVEAAVRVLGDQGLKNCYLLFTGGDRLKDMTLEDFIFEDDEGSLPNVVHRFSGRFHMFNNEDKDQEQVRDLLLKSKHLRTPAGSDVRREDRRIILIGAPGAGKSSSGNTILRSDKFKSGCDFDAVSTDCTAESAEMEGRQLTVVDTPGITDELLTEQLYKSIVLASPGPHAFLIVVRLGRISETDVRLFEILQKLFNSDASKYAMVLFTHGDELRGRSIEDLIQVNKHVSKLVSMCAGRYCVFDNTKRGNGLQVKHLLNKIDEMVTANGGDHYTSEMFRMAETFIKEETNRSDMSTERVLSGPSPGPEGSGPGPIPSGPSTERVPSGPSDGATPASDGILRRAWERLKRFFRRLFSIRIRSCFSRSPPDISSCTDTVMLVSVHNESSETSETDPLIKKNE